MGPQEYDNLPENIKEIVDSYNEDCKNPYRECARIVKELEQNGWTADYDLSGQLFDIEKL